MNTSEQPLSAEQVSTYLRDHPDFFQNQEALLENLRIPHHRGVAISLVERQLNLLRERNQQLSRHLEDLMSVARENERLFDKTRKLILSLIECETFEEMVAVVEDGLRHDFKIPYVSLILISETGVSVGKSVTLSAAQQALGGMLASRQIICGSLRAHELAFLFPGQSTEIGSAALALLERGGLQGILAVGNPDPLYYKSNLDTLFLSYLSEVITRLLPQPSQATAKSG